MGKDFFNKIHLGITGETNSDWQTKLEEINERKVDMAAVFLERFEKDKRDFFTRTCLSQLLRKFPWFQMIILRRKLEKVGAFSCKN
jgi:hypothetical protein